MKFGGAAMADPESIRAIVEVIRSSTGEKVVVVSAAASVTDLLLEFITKPRREADIPRFVAELRERHRALLPAGADGDALDRAFLKVERLLYGITYTEELTEKTRDLILSFGERLAAEILAAHLRAAGADAVAVETDAAGLVTDTVHGNATALFEACAGLREGLRALVAAGKVPVVTGYFGISTAGHVTTFGRGGSDYSAAVIAHVLGAPEVEVWKDVDGFLSADPRIVPTAFELPTLSYDEAAELAYFGAKVLHPRAIQPARLGGFRIRVRNFRDPAKPGTVIQENGHRVAGTLKSVSILRRLATVKVAGTGAGLKSGTLREIADALSTAGVNVYSATTSQTVIALLIRGEDLALARQALAGITGGVLESVAVEEDIALVCGVGEGLHRTPGVAARVFRAVADAGVNVHLISAGASDVAYHFTVDAGDVEAAVRAIHAEFFGGAS